uniref:Leucine-rich repeat-containing N-terminal plant-type domain-containing protein n=1 Tax=Populus trichocarpa TaxID=3694 RepID=B9NGY9_POPTR
MFSFESTGMILLFFAAELVITASQVRYRILFRNGQTWRNCSGLNGPIPSGIALLEKMADMRISDLHGNGAEAPFPPLTNMKNLKTLILRSCNIIGPLPDFVGELPKLTTLNLSFNKLIGEIPSSFNGLRKADYIYLTGNQLNGTVPNWITMDGESV